MKTKNSKYLFFLILFLSFVFVPINPLTLTAVATTNTTKISAGDIIKNFRFASIGNEPIVSRGAFDNKLRFEKQDEWTLNRDTILNSIDTYSVPNDDGGYDVYLRYKIEASTRVNIFTNFIINQVSETFYDMEEEFVGGTYNHFGCFGGAPFISWTEYITWEHWDFGESIIIYNTRENIFSDTIIMEFDISTSPLPDIFGDEAENEWAYIVVDSAGVVNNEMGDMSVGELPTTVTLNPSSYDSELRNEYTQTDEKTKTKSFDAVFDPMTFLTDPYLKEQFAEGIIPQSVGSSLNPRNLDGSYPWDPEDQSKSMMGCRLEYDMVSLSPKVRRMSATLSYYETTLATIDALSGFEWIVKEFYYNDAFRIEYGDTSLQVINRYIQPEIRVIFDIWTKVDIGALIPYYEEMRLEKPEEFYEELIWSSIAGGWGGSYQRTSPIGFELNDILMLIIIIVIAIVAIYIFIQFGIPLIARKKAMDIIKR